MPPMLPSHTFPPVIYLKSVVKVQSDIIVSSDTVPELVNVQASEKISS